MFYSYYGTFVSAYRGVTLAWFYLFLHAVLRYFYYQHTSLYNFFTSLNHASLPNAPTVNAQFTFQFSSHSLTYWHPMRPLWSKKNAQNSLWEADYLFKKWTLWMWSLARMEQCSFLIKSQQTCNTLRTLKLCAIYPQLCMEFLTILGTTALMANSLRHTGQLQSLHHQNLAQNNIWYCPNFVCHFLFHFLRAEILELTATKHLWTYLHLNERNKFSFMNVLVQLLYSLRQGFLIFFGAFQSLVKTTDPSHKNTFKIHKINYTDYISSIAIYIIVFTA